MPNCIRVLSETSIKTNATRTTGFFLRPLVMMRWRQRSPVRAFASLRLTAGSHTPTTETVWSLVCWCGANTSIQGFGSTVILHNGNEHLLWSFRDVVDILWEEHDRRTGILPNLVRRLCLPKDPRHREAATMSLAAVVAAAACAVIGFPCKEMRVVAFSECPLCVVFSTWYSILPPNRKPGCDAADALRMPHPGVP